LSLSSAACIAVFIGNPSSISTDDSC
jgi:hypothetical protein